MLALFSSGRHVGGIKNTSSKLAIVVFSLALLSAAAYRRDINNIGLVKLVT